MQRVSGEVTPSIVYGKSGVFSGDEEGNAPQIKALRDFLWDPKDIATKELKELFQEAYPVEYQQEIQAVRRQLAKIAKGVIAQVCAGENIVDEVNRSLASDGIIGKLLSKLRYLGDVESVKQLFERAGAFPDELCHEVQVEYNEGYIGSIPTLVYIVGNRRFGRGECSFYSPEESIDILKKLSNLGYEKASDFLVSAYSENHLGRGAARVGLNLSRGERALGIRNLAEKGNFCALQTIGFIAKNGCLEKGVWRQSPEQRKRLFTLGSQKEDLAKPLQWITESLVFNRVGDVCLNISLDERLRQLHARASCQDAGAIRALYEAYQTGFLGRDFIDMSVSVRRDLSYRIVCCDETLFCEELRNEGIVELLEIRSEQGSLPATNTLAHIYRIGADILGLGALQKRNLLRELANKGSEEARVSLLERFQPGHSPLSAEISEETIFSWALAGSERAREVFIMSQERERRPVLRMAFALLFAVK